MDELDDKNREFLRMHMAMHSKAREILGLSEAEYHALCEAVAGEEENNQ